MIVYLEDPMVSAQNLLKLSSHYRKSQDTKSMCKNHKDSFTPITDLEPNQEQTAIHNCYKENKIPRNTTNKVRKGTLQGELQSTDQRNKRGHKQIEKHSMFVVRKNQL